MVTFEEEFATCSTNTNEPVPDFFEAGGGISGANEGEDGEGEQSAVESAAEQRVCFGHHDHYYCDADCRFEAEFRALFQSEIQKSKIEPQSPATGAACSASLGTRTVTGAGAFSTRARAVPRIMTQAPIQIQMTMGLTWALMMGWPLSFWPS